MQRDPLEPGAADHGPAGRLPPPPVALEERRVDPGGPAPARRQERHPDRDAVPPVDLRRSRLSRRQSPSKRGDPLLPPRAPAPVAYPAAPAEIRAASRHPLPPITRLGPMTPEQGKYALSHIRYLEAE